MTRQDILLKLNEIFRDILDNETLTLTEETVFEDIDAWDSLAQVMIVMAAQEAFGIKFIIDEVTGIKSVREMADLIQQKVR